MEIINKPPKGFIPLIEYEELFQDKLLISFPSSKYRKNNIIYSSTNNKFYEITRVVSQGLYRIPELKEIEYGNKD